MSTKLTRLGIFATSVSLVLATSQPTKVVCESKRSFYAEETEVKAAVGEPTELQIPKLVRDEVTVESFFESKIKLAREELFKYLDASKQVYIDKSNDYYHNEREVFSTVSSLHDKREELFPDALYVLTGGLLGSVFARNRNILVKILAPLACGIISFRFFFPMTSGNVFGFLDNAERSSLPDVYTKQTELINKTEELIKKTADLPGEGSKGITALLERTKKIIAEYTGLNVDQSITDRKK